MNEMLPIQALDGRYYTDPEMYRRTCDRIFDRAWHYVCHQSQIPEQGDYLAFELLGERLFVSRGKAGKIRCFYNVCQHRGHTLVQDSGRTRVFVCPYHAWTYEQDGGLRAAPATRQMAGFERARICLTQVKVEVFLGFVFVNFDDQADDMDTQFPGVRAAAMALCPDIEERVFAHEHRAQEFCNWLVAVENYNECYHCGHCHKAFSNGIIEPRSYDIQPFGMGRCLNHAAKAAEGDGAWYDTSGSDYGSFYLFPLFSLQIYPSGMINTYYWRPVSHDDTFVHRGWYNKDGVVDDQLQEVIDLDRDTTFAEDLALVKEVQKGLGSRGYKPGPLVIPTGTGINSEHSIAALHRWVVESLA
ncbi:MAG: aromatic ring-hydroxylating dioxygenase subunit alpha [Pseudomonadota bacterium]